MSSYPPNYRVVTYQDVKNIKGDLTRFVPMKNDEEIKNVEESEP